MKIITHLAVLAAACLFGYRSTDSFELLMAGLVLLVVALLIAAERHLLGQFKVVMIRVLKLEQPQNEELIGMVEDAMVKIESPSIDGFAAMFFALTSTALLFKSIYLMLN